MTNPLTQIEKRIAELEELEKKATPGPWVANVLEPVEIYDHSGQLISGSFCGFKQEENAKLIVALRNPATLKLLSALLEVAKATTEYQRQALLRVFELPPGMWDRAINEGWGPPIKVGQALWKLESIAQSMSAEGKT